MYGEMGEMSNSMAVGGIRCTGCTRGLALGSTAKVGVGGE